MSDFIGPIKYHRGDIGPDGRVFWAYDAAHSDGIKWVNGSLIQAWRDRACKSSLRYANGHPQEIRDRFHGYYQSHPSRCAQTSKLWHASNRPRINDGRRRLRTERGISQNTRVMGSIRSRVWWFLKSETGRGRTPTLVGVDLDGLKLYLSSKFLPGMSWGNWGNGPGRWNIDHIKPLSTFSNLRDPGQSVVAFHYTNLQPMWWIDNMRKGAKLDFVLDKPEESVIL